MKELLTMNSNTKGQHGSCNCSSMSSINNELLVMSSIILKDDMEVATANMRNQLSYYYTLAYLRAFALPLS
jgi:hypothetical protein